MSDAEPAFPLHLLKPTGGSLYATLWKNEYCPLALRWSCTVGFAPVPYGESTEDTAATVEDFEPKIGHWRDLVGFRVEADADDAQPNGSFYLMDHRPAQQMKLEILGADGLSFKVHMRLRVDLNDRYDLEDPPLDEVDVVATVPFDELVVDRRVVPKKTVEDAIDVLRPFIDPSCLEYTRFDGNFWRFKPKL